MFISLGGTDVVEDGPLPQAFPSFHISPSEVVVMESLTHSSYGNIEAPIVRSGDLLIGISSLALSIIGLLLLMFFTQLQKDRMDKNKDWIQVASKLIPGQGLLGKGMR